MMPLKRLLRSPKTIVAEVAMLAASAALSTLVPQVADTKASALFSEEHPGVARVCHTLFVDRVWTSPWMTALLLLALGSLAIVLQEQWKRLFQRWRFSPTVESFARAPYCLNFTRPARGAQAESSSAVFSRGRLGLLGSPLFHAGLTLVLAAGLVRVLFVAQAAVNLVEGETLPAGSTAYGAHWDGLLAAPFRLDLPLRLEALSPEAYPSGELKSLAAAVSYGGRPRRIAVNEPLTDGFRTMYLTPSHGPAVLIRFGLPGRFNDLAVLLLETVEPEIYAASAVTQESTEIKLTCAVRRGMEGGLPTLVDTRVLRGGALLFSGSIPVGRGTVLPMGERLEMLEARRWAEFRGSRDPSLPVAYVGFLLAAAGATLLFTVVPVDAAVSVRPAGDSEEVFIAMWPRRFAPLYRERFKRFAEAHGASEELLK